MKGNGPHSTLLTLTWLRIYLPPSMSGTPGNISSAMCWLTLAL